MNLNPASMAASKVFPIKKPTSNNPLYRKSIARVLKFKFIAICKIIARLLFGFFLSNDALNYRIHSMFQLPRAYTL